MWSAVFAGSVVRLSVNCLFCVCTHAYWHILDVANRHQVSKDLDHSPLSHRWRCGAGYISPVNKDKLRQTLRHCQWLTLKRRAETTTKSQMTVEMSCILTVGSAVLSCAVLSAVVVFHCFVCALLFLTVVRLWTVCYWTGLLRIIVNSRVSRVCRPSAVQLWQWTVCPWCWRLCHNCREHQEGLFVARKTGWGRNFECRVIYSV